MSHPNEHELAREHAKLVNIVNSLPTEHQHVSIGNMHHKAPYVTLVLHVLPCDSET